MISEGLKARLLVIAEHNEPGKLTLFNRSLLAKFAEIKHSGELFLRIARVPWLYVGCIGTTW
jgi:hypothetical protein